MSNLLQQKRHKFRQQIRSEYLENYTKQKRQEFKIKYETQKNEEAQALNDLIDSTEKQISQEDFEKLISYAIEKDENNAIIHMGNLLIEGAVNGQWIVEKFQLRPKKSRYWPWLMKVIISLNQQQNFSENQGEKYQLWEFSCFDYALQLITNQMPASSLEECLMIIKLLIGKYLTSVGEEFFTTYRFGLFSIKQHCLNIEKSISCLCFEIIDMIVEAREDYTRKLVELYTLPEMQQLMILGLGKVDLSQKKFPLIACRTINNILSTGIIVGQNLINACRKVSYNQKNTDKTKLELSYLWYSYVENCSLAELAQNYDVIFHIIEEIMRIGTTKENSQEKIKENFENIINMIVNKSQGFNSREMQMHVKSKAAILFKHYIHCQKLFVEPEAPQPIDLNRLKQIYDQKTFNLYANSHEKQQIHIMTDLESDLMDLEN